MDEVDCTKKEESNDKDSESNSLTKKDMQNGCEKCDAGMCFIYIEQTKFTTQLELCMKKYFILQSQFNMSKIINYVFTRH